jgi:hypothetical protein
MLAVVGAWSILFAPFRRLLGSILRFPTSAITAVIVAVCLRLIWIRLARRPQKMFQLAAASEAKVDEFRRMLADGMRNGAAYDSLLRLYLPIVRDIQEAYGEVSPGMPLDVSGRQCLVMTCLQGPERSVDDVLAGAAAGRGAEWKRRTSSFAQERQTFMATSRRSFTHQNRFGDDHGDNAILDWLRPAAALEMIVGAATYGQIVRTSDSLINEFALFGYISGRSALRGRPKPLEFGSGDLLKVLPWRRDVHSWDEGVDVLLTPRGRASGIGVSVALVDRTGPRPTVTVGRRSSRVGTYPDVLHVIPAGMMNLHGEGAGRIPADLGLLPRLTMMAEFIEECFDVEELSGHSVVNFAGLVDDEVAKRGLGELTPVLTGVAIDLLNLRVEICAVLDLTDYPDVMDGFRVNWEYSHNERLQRVDLERGASGLDRTDFVQSGLGCIHLAAQWLGRHYTGRP